MRLAPLVALLLCIPAPGFAAGPGAAPSDPPDFACPAGSEPRLRAPNYPKGSIAASLALVHSEAWCALPGPDSEVHHGPYRALDQDGHWIEWGEYEAVRRNGVPDRRVGHWRHRTPGTCGDWVEWSSWEGPVRPTREQSHAFASAAVLAAREVDCGQGRKARSMQSGPGSLDQVRSEPHAAVSKVCIAEDGTPDGPGWTWFENGAPRSEDHYRRGVRHGEFRAWHSNGGLRWQGSFREGREQGLWRAFGCRGEPRCEGRAEAGRIVGGWQCAAGEAPPEVGWLESLSDTAPRPRSGR